MNVSYIWGEDIRFRENFFVDYADPVFYYGRKIVDGVIVPFIRPMENKITLGFTDKEIELDFSFEWDTDNKKWKKTQRKRKIKI